MDKKYKRLFKNTLWTLVGNTGSKMLAFFLLPLYTRWLGTEGFGLSDLITTYSTMLVGIITLCTADGIFIFTKNKQFAEQQQYFSTTIKISMLLFLLWMVIFCCMQLVFKVFFIHNAFADNLWLIFGIVFSTFLQNYTQQFIISLEKMKIYSLTGIILCISTFIFSWLMIPNMGVKGYVLAIIIANVVTSIYSFVFSKSWCYLQIRGFQSNKARELLAYSIPLIPNAVMWWLVQALNRPVMESNLGYSAIGIYAVANKFPGVITMVFSLFAVSWNISVFEEYGKPTFENFYTKIFRMLFFVIISGTLLLCLSSQLIIRTFAAPEFTEAWKYMVILMIGAAISCMSAFWGTVFGVVKQSKYFFYSSVWGALSSVGANFLLIPNWGLYGASISVFISYMVMAFSRYLYSRKFVSAKLLNVSLLYIGLMVGVSVGIILFDNIFAKILVTGIGILILCFLERNSCKELLLKFKWQLLAHRPTRKAED